MDPTEIDESWKIDVFYDDKRIPFDTKVDTVSEAEALETFAHYLIEGIVNKESKIVGVSIKLDVNGNNLALVSVDCRTLEVRNW